MVIAWRSQNHKTVTPSVIEAEYLSFLGSCFKILFICAILLFLVFVFEFPITVHIDNFGAIIMREHIGNTTYKSHICMSPFQPVLC